VAWTAGLATAATVVAIPLLPAEVWGDWLGTVAPTGAYGTVPWCSISPAAPWNQSLNGFVARLFLENEFSPVLVDSPRLARIVPYLAAIAVLSASAWAAAGRGLAGAPRERIDLTWSLFLLALALVAPLTWLHHLVLVLPAALVALRLALEQHRSPLPAVVVGLALAVLAWALPVWSPQLQHGPLVLGISVKLYAILALWGYLLWRARAGA